MKTEPNNPVNDFNSLRASYRLAEAANQAWRLRRVLAALFLAVLALVIFYVYPLVNARELTTRNAAAARPGDPKPAPVDLQPVIPTTPTLTPARAPTRLPSMPAPGGLIVLSISEGGYYHLFGYTLGGSPLIRITSGQWDDVSPAISPDGSQLAFSSNRSGQWDLYRMSLADGEITPLTNGPEYDDAPSWSPDGQWLAYESYGPENGANLDIFLRPLDGSVAPVRLTDDLAPDHSPAWAPDGRQIAFVSSRSGQDEIWLADLDKVDGRFTNLSRTGTAAEDQPVWSPDGGRLAWSTAPSHGLQTIQVWNNRAPELSAKTVGAGSIPAWSPDGQVLTAVLSEPNASYLTAYDLNRPSLALPAIALPGPAAGMTWRSGSLEAAVTAAGSAPAITPTPLWEALITPTADLPGGRSRTVPLKDVDAVNAMLLDTLDESFQALRARVARQAGWDFLAGLENAFIPLTEPLGPGMNQDWLYTGRAFGFNPAPFNAGWVVIQREDFGAETYWRVYLRTRFQDGSQGQPLHSPPWNFGARLSGDPRAYEEGGAQATSAPAGYWLDFTDLAAAYGWQRLPALSSWRQDQAGAQYNKFYFPERRAWLEAMLEIYPHEALDTPTPSPPPTQTPTITPWPTRTPYLSSTPWPTHPPSPTSTRWPTYTPTVTNTPRVTPTPQATP
jgi:TolB protein